MTEPKVPVHQQATLAGLAADAAAMEEPRIYSADFRAWYKDYPRKRAPGDAWKAWQAIRERPALAVMLAALGWQRRTDDWIRDEGRWIPYPASYLRARQWEDEPPKRADYCAFHRSIRNNSYPAPRPMPSCPECKHVAASRAQRQGQPETAGQVIEQMRAPTPKEPSTTDAELAADFRRLFPGEPWPGHADAFKRVTRQLVRGREEQQRRANTGDEPT